MNGAEFLVRCLENERQPMERPAQEPDSDDPIKSSSMH